MGTSLVTVMRNQVTPGGRRAASILAGALLLVLGGCAGGNGSGGVLAGSPQAANGTLVQSGTAVDPNSRLTPFERQRLLNRIGQDPRQIQRLSMRERRELAGMIEAVNNKQDEE